MPKAYSTSNGMKRFVIAVIILILGFGISWYLVMRVRPNEKIFETFEREQSQLFKTAVLSFPAITDDTRSSLAKLPDEIRKVIPAGSSQIVVRKVTFEGNVLGYVVTGSVPIVNTSVFSQSYGGQIRNAGWRNVSGARREDALIREIENDGYRAKGVFLMDNANALHFGLMAISK